MNKIESFHEKISSGKNIAIFFVIFTLFFMLFRILNPEFERLSSGLKIPDVAIVFSGTDLYALFKSYGEGARSFYNYIQLVDAFYPLAYGLFFLSVIYFYVGKLFSKDSFFRYLIVVPYFAVFSDYVENITIFIMNRLFPHKFGIVANLSYFFSFLKWVFFISSVLLILIGTIFFFTKKIKQQKG